MIKVSKVLSRNKKKIIGVSIEINGNNHIVMADQRVLDGIRKGTFPSYYNAEVFQMEPYPEEEILRLETN